MSQDERANIDSFRGTFAFKLNEIMTILNLPCVKKLQIVPQQRTIGGKVETLVTIDRHSFDKVDPAIGVQAKIVTALRDIGDGEAKVVSRPNRIEITIPAPLSELVAMDSAGWSKLSGVLRERTSALRLTQMDIVNAEQKLRQGGFEGQNEQLTVEATKILARRSHICAAFCDMFNIMLPQFNLRRMHFRGYNNAASDIRLEETPDGQVKIYIPPLATKDETDREIAENLKTAFDHLLPRGSEKKTTFEDETVKVTDAKGTHRKKVTVITFPSDIRRLQTMNRSSFIADTRGNEYVSNGPYELRYYAHPEGVAGRG